MTAMVKSPAHWTQPASDKGSAAQEQKQLKPGKSDFKLPADGDVHSAAKVRGRGFSNNPVDVLVRGDNPSALPTRETKVHDYSRGQTDFGSGSGAQRVEIQNRQPVSRKRR
jgi:hypothetical protein